MAQGDCTFEPDLQGIIQTIDGAAIFNEYLCYRRAYPLGRRRIVVAVLTRATMRIINGPVIVWQPALARWEPSVAA